MQNYLLNKVISKMKKKIKDFSLLNWKKLKVWVFCKIKREFPLKKYWFLKSLFLKSENKLGNIIIDLVSVR